MGDPCLPGARSPVKYHYFHSFFTYLVRRRASVAAPTGPARRYSRAKRQGSPAAPAPGAADGESRHPRTGVARRASAKAWPFRGQVVAARASRPARGPRPVPAAYGAGQRPANAP